MNNQAMMQYLWELPGQFEYSLQHQEAIPILRAEIRNIVVSGMGGSAIGGDILRCLAFSQARVPILVNRSYDIPHLVGEDTLFLAVSYSGGTEETLAAYEQARQRGAQVVCVSSGGRLEELAKADNYPHIKVPGGLMPRVANGFLFGPMVLLLEKAGILTGVQDDLREAIEVLYQMREELNPQAPQEGNTAWKAARAMKNALPVIWGAYGPSETAALRWKAQINENAKSPAYYATFPELNHNEIVGFQVPPEIVEQICLVILRDNQDHPRISKRMDITEKLVEGKIKALIEVASRGESWLARYYSLTYIGDYASTYLAEEYELDSLPIPVIDYLKAELAK
ncbi:MAG TPA: bifunctional phosphoglucose/phosphomannose isomerase [Syntrophomonadaceae bacterium]|nr:bifunctional phosphoglucose/phosphomannose isomerase [Syntrophomonadaceae bacterium]